MPLTPGTRIGAYEVDRLLGIGGMGEVYRARDTKLGRAVALKVLSPLVANEPDRLARFRREAQVLASLNDPHIAQIYGFEDGDGTHALIMELVDGPTLAERIGDGRPGLVLHDALTIACQIAQALEAAHEQGIVHRDLKPANVKVRQDGTVKVLDFGLAKALAPAPESRAATPNSPTLTTRATELGLILGTAAYMAPEQARGGLVDRRADIWAFGVVLFEMLTGRRLFAGETVSDTLAAVLRQEIDWTMLPEGTPGTIRHLLRRCLDRDPKQRLRDIGEARVLLSSSDEDAAALPPVAVVPPARRLTMPHALAAAAALAAVGVAGYAGGRHAGSPVEHPPAYFELSIAPATALGPAVVLGRPRSATFATTADGRRIVFTGTSGDDGHEAATRLYVRDLGEPFATPIAGTDGAEDPFLSPDAAWVGFFAGGRIRRVPIAGGSIVTVADLTTGDQPPATTLTVPARDFYGATWTSGNDIVIGRYADGLWQVPASGGTLTRLIAPTTGDGRAYRQPRELPGGRGLLFTIAHAVGTVAPAIAVLPRGESTQRVLIEDGADARYAPSGHLVFVRRGTLMAAPFDLDRLTVTGKAVVLIEGVQQAVQGRAPALNSTAAQFDLAGSGTLVFATGGIFPAIRNRMVRVSRTGEVEPIASPEGDYARPVLSPDGGRIAVTYESQDEGGIFVLDVARGSFRRLAKAGWGPAWSHDGTRVFFSAPSPSLDLSAVPADGSSPPQALVEKVEAYPGAASPDGSTLAFLRVERATGMDIWTLALDGTSSATPWLRTSANEGWTDLSPDGHWMAYASDASGRNEVYVRPFPGPGSPEQISVDGGDSPRWSRDGREIFFLTGRAPAAPGQPAGSCMMAASVTVDGRIAAGPPHQLFCGSYGRLGGLTSYDLSHDGRRFIMLQTLDSPAHPITRLSVITDWIGVLRQQTISGGPGRSR